MSKRKKAFDCVRMKHEAQKKLRAEYEGSKDEFDDYFAFLDAKSRESDRQRRFWAKLETADAAS